MDDWQTENLVPFGRYHLGARIASGGMGEVYLAKMKGAAGFEKRVVIKKILPQLSRDPEFVKRFIDEGKLVVKLSHANIVPVLDLGEVDGDYFLAMDFVDGADLREILRRLAAEGRRLPLGLALFILVEVARGLHYAHQRTDDDGRPLHIIHRDISPANVMLSRDGAVRIVDFGIAKARDRLAHSITGALQGKFVYMSPEQARGEALDHRSDLFSLGSVAYELLAGVRPFEGRTDLQTLEKVKRCEPAPLSEVRPDLPAPVVAAVQWCLERDPVQRCGSAEALQRALQEQLFLQPQPPGERELGAFVRDVVGSRATPVVDLRGRRLDDVLVAELDRVRGGSRNNAEATATATQDVPIVRGTPASGPTPPPGTQTGTLTGTGLTGANRAILAGLVLLIAVLLYFNIRSLSDDAEPPAPAPDVAAGTAVVPEAPAPDAGQPAAAGLRADAIVAPPPDTGPAKAVAERPDAAPERGDVASAPVRSLVLRDLREGDEVRVDDEPVAPDAGGRIPLPADGAATVVVRRADHEPFEHVVPAGEATPAAVTVEPRPERRQVQVVTEPAGATLWVDGRKGGQAPDKVTLTFGKTTEVEARLDGYETARRALRWDSPASVTLKLAPLPTGRVTFRLFPANAEAFLNGKRRDTGGGNLVQWKLPAGSYTLLVRSAGQEVRREFEIEPGKDVNLKTLQLE